MTIVTLLEDQMIETQEIKSAMNWASVRLWMLMVALVATLSMAFTAEGQVLYGSLTGTITDKSGAVVADGSITLTNQGTGETRTTKSGPQGDYRFGDVLPGVYSISVAPTGNFAGFAQKNITVEVNREIRINIALVVGSVEQSVTVTDAPAPLQTETAEVSSEISETQLAQLPVGGTQGRNYQSLYTLIPGAANPTEQNSTASNPSRAMSVNVNGVEDMSNTTRIDGAMNYYGWLPYLVAYVPPADSIENVNIITNSFNAEQGLAGGAAISITIKSGTHDFHGSAWEYYQDAALNARGYTATPQASPTVPKNVFDQYGFNIGGPVYIPKLATGKKKLFFFENFERTTRRQLISGFVSVPDAAMLGGDFSEVAANAGLLQGNGTQFTGMLYDPQPGGVPVPVGTPNSHNGYYDAGYRPTFQSEYGCNCIPSSRIVPQASKMLALLQPISARVTPTSSLLSAQMSNDYFGTGTLAYNRNTSDTKIDYAPSENTQIFGRYSVEPFSVSDPQNLGAAGGGTFDGGQPGAASGRVQNVGLGASHVFSQTLVMDADFGYTRQVTGAQSSIDIADGNFGTDVLGIPGTNGVGANYAGQPALAFGAVSSNGSTTGFSSLGNANGANPFLFRDNQFTGDVNLSWTKSKHATKYGISYYHFDLNHFQPTSGGGISTARGGFAFQGGMTVGALDLDSKGNANTPNSYTALADFMLGLPNQGNGTAVARASQIANPNSLRWTEFGAYAQDQWTATSKLTVNYGVRYEFYPAPYRDHTGVYILNPALPQSANVEVGGVNGLPQNSGLDMGYGFFAPRLGFAYRLNDKTVIRAGGGLTTDPDSLRFLRDAFPMDQAPAYSGPAANTIAVDTGNTTGPYGNAGQPMTLAYGIPLNVPPSFATGFASLPISGGTNTAPQKYRRGYIESWNLFIQRDLGHQYVANVGYVGTHQVRQLVGYTLDAAPIPSIATTCMPNGQYNPSSGLTGPCSFQANTIVNQLHCTGTSNPVCYNTGGITMNAPSMSAGYSGLQAQLTYNASKLAQYGVVYTWSKAYDYEDNGAGSGSAGTANSYPAYFPLMRSLASYDRTHNLQIWGIYNLPFGHGHALAKSGIASAILGGFQLNGQYSHVSGAPFSVNPASSGLNAPGNTLFAELVGSYKQEGGHNRTVGNNSVSGGKPWFDPSVFTTPTEPGQTPATNPDNASPTFSNTRRNEFRGPGVSALNASIFRSFQVYRKSSFQLRFEAFNATNHPQLTNPNSTVGGGTFGYITAFGNSRTLQFGGRYLF